MRGDINFKGSDSSDPSVYPHTVLQLFQRSCSYLPFFELPYFETTNLTINRSCKDGVNRYTTVEMLNKNSKYVYRMMPCITNTNLVDVVQPFLHHH